jgi:hypothetical protein
MNLPADRAPGAHTSQQKTSATSVNPTMALRRGPSPASLRWKAAAAELAPEKSLARVATNSKYVIATVTIVGTALTGLGLVGADTLSTHPQAGFLAAIAVVLAGAAVVLALSTLVLRSKPVNLENLAAVRQWYTDEFDRAKFVRWAGILLVLAVIIALGAGLTATLVENEQATIGLQVMKTGTTRTASVAVTAGDLRPGAMATVSLYGVPSSGAPATLIVAQQTADSSGAVTVEATLEKADAYPRYNAVLEVDGKELAGSEVKGIG